MKLPPLLLGAVLLFWGWEIDLPYMGGIFAVLVEGTRLLRTRWEPADEDLNRIWNLCALIFIAAAVYAFTANQGPAAISRMVDDPSLASQRLAGESSQKTAASLIQWLPMIFFPFLFALAVSQRSAVKLGVFSLVTRRRKIRREPAFISDREVNADWIYFSVALLSASINNKEGNEFFLGLSVLLAWALWTRRSARFAWPVWLVVIVAACGIGFASQRQLGELRRLVENFTPQWSWRWVGRRTNPISSKTQIGQIGQLKQSGSIVIRLELKDGTPAPPLLRTASYRSYQNGAWSARSFLQEIPRRDREKRDREPREGRGQDRERRDQREPRAEGETDADASTRPAEGYPTGGRVESGARAMFGPMQPDSKTGSWIFREGNSAMRINIATYVDDVGDPGDPLPLPLGFSRFEDLPAATLKTNHLGVVAATTTSGANILLFDVLYGPGGSIDGPPEDPELYIPFNERPGIEKLAAEIPLEGKSTNQMIRAVSAYFQEHFTYSLWQKTRYGNGTNTPLADFLAATNRSGHCEYFATATTLLLRQLRIPTRYAVGWSVQEINGTSGVVRERHAHAWCLYYLNDQWHDLDTTPSSWVAEENRQAGAFQIIGDFFSRIKFEFLKWRAGQSTLRDYIWWIVGPMLLFLLYRLVRRRSGKRARAKADAEEHAFARLGLDSEFYQVEKKLADFGFVRPAGETLGQFLERALRDARVATLQDALQALLRAHYRLRFDPLGLQPEERDALRQRVRETLNKLGEVRRAGPVKTQTATP